MAHLLEVQSPLLVQHQGLDESLTILRGKTDCLALLVQKLAFVRARVENPAEREAPPGVGLHHVQKSNSPTQFGSMCTKHLTPPPSTSSWHQALPAPPAVSPSGNCSCRCLQAVQSLRSLLLLVDLLP